MLFVPQANALNDSAVFAGGCFWCLEHDFESLKGVLSVESGYTGGKTIKPTYKNHKGHQEAIKITFDPLEVSFEELLKTYWRNIDPYDGGGQFCDRGDSYRPVIFYKDNSQYDLANNSLINAAEELSASSNNLAVKIERLDEFWEAEDYHQDFAQRNSVKYKFYRYSCGRDQRLDEVWGVNAREGIKWLKKMP
ncbi:Peptide methionine sulfoxide reductase MsrA [Prochlorococcus marinus str. SS51]|uniref:peptide-methionine (S)-S-oxide reductase MsrA n=1 Tax=Prochlorococcus sp. SS52 TaxID=1499501 RepID=UPI000533B4B9|nr:MULTISPECIES: peptide-methionine (S)-S-oxide reductase MsrA [Prochlorococcus]KGG14339.1 Peptide methionine sulfoxide reductase MsrA [Prochlorococcus marinus str. LG]KGG22087.1 Peptide methionine sulfoxide reductase MsrA [Prochlorococcus marinus str. SS2]KGG24595.1 Peptide methionine sulfoxide reductase MsrA [Prochlorococcus marinus str. SS35]KGG33488.1 Peptide methionine sulfoxide reductase MsrA [Prochlorococcus marinus str. SS51]